ncbi:hypothetical protein Tco_0123457 [Tanacetum coccineum]
MVEKPVWNNARRVNHQNSQKLTHPHSKRNFVPRAVLMKSGLKTLNTTMQNSSRAAVYVNTARSINTAYQRPILNYARPTSNVFKRAHSHVKRPFNKFTTNKNSNFNEKVNTVRGNVTTVRPKAVVSDNKGNEANAIMKKLMVDLLPLVETQRSKIQMTIQKDDEYVGAKADMTNLDSHIPVRPIPTTRIHKDHPLSQIIGDIMNTTSNQKNYRNKTAQKNPKRFQVNPKVSHLHAVKRIFRYLKGQPKLGLWYPKDSPFDLVHICDRDNVEQVLDSKSQQEDVNSYSALDSKSIAGLWIYFMNTKIFIDNKSTICIVKNLVFHSKTKHIEIKHHFIRDSRRRVLIQMIKIHTDQNVAICSKAFVVLANSYQIARLNA